MSSFFTCHDEKKHLQYPYMRKIALSQVKKSLFYSFSFPEHLDSLSTSIQQYGVIQPILLSPSFHLVCGLRRLNTCRKLQINSIPAIILKNNVPPLFLFRMNIADNLSVRPLNILEKARILAMLKNNFKVFESDIAANFLPLLGLPAHIKYLQKFIRIDKLPRRIKTAIIDRKMPAQFISNIETWPQAAINHILPVLFGFNFGSNKTSQIIELLNEISAITGNPIAAPLNNQQWLKIYNNPNLSPFQKGSGLRMFLLGKRYPVYSELKTKIMDYIANLELPSNISIAINELLSLEKKQISFKVQCKQPKDLEKAALVLTTAANRPALRDLLLLLQM